MLHWIRQRKPMTIARITFKPEHARYFIDQADGQRHVIEVAFDSPESLIETVKEFEHAIIDVIAIVDDSVVALSSFMV